MGLWLDAMSLPSSSIKVNEGVWNEIEFATSGCGSLIDSNGKFQATILIYVDDVLMTSTTQKIMEYFKNSTKRTNNWGPRISER